MLQFPLSLASCQGPSESQPCRNEQVIVSLALEESRGANREISVSYPAVATCALQAL